MPRVTERSVSSASRRKSTPFGQGARRNHQSVSLHPFPGYFGNSSVNISTIKYHIGVRVEKLYEKLSEQILAGLCFANDCEHETPAELQHQRAKAGVIAAKAIMEFPRLRKILATDIEAAYEGDPAAVSQGEIISCYPVIKAITNYRLAHELYKLGVPLIPRMMTELAHSETGIDIHPEATIGKHFTIDHGTGVVIGATCIIGDNVKLYQGVTLGAKSFPLDKNGNPIKGIPRHPILQATSSYMPMPLSWAESLSARDA